MSSKKFKKWIDINNRNTCLKIAQKYFKRKETGKNLNPFEGSFIILLIKRLFFIFITLFRFNQNPYQKYLNSKNPKEFIKRFIGLYKLEVKNLLPQQSIFEDLSFKPQTDPLVSIIIAVYNNWEYTYNCLVSLLSYTQELIMKSF